MAKSLVGLIEKEIKRLDVSESRYPCEGLIVESTKDGIALSDDYADYYHGDRLLKILQELKPEDVSLDEMEDTYIWKLISGAEVEYA